MLAKGEKFMSYLPKLFAMVLVASLTLCANAMEKPATPQAETHASSTATDKHDQSRAKHAAKAVLHGLSPVIWVQYLAKREYCTYAFSQAYGMCEGNAARPPR